MYEATFEMLSVQLVERTVLEDANKRQLWTIKPVFLNFEIIENLKSYWN